LRGGALIVLVREMAMSHDLEFADMPIAPGYLVLEVRELRSVDSVL